MGNRDGEFGGTIGSKDHTEMPRKLEIENKRKSQLCNEFSQRKPKEDLPLPDPFQIPDWNQGEDERILNNGD
jgi:hypothetical protein